MQDVIVSDGTGGGYDGSDKTIVYINSVVNSNKWVQLDIRKSVGGTWAFDYTVRVYQSGTTNLLGMEDVRTDVSYRSKRYSILHFGLGNITTIDVIISKGNSIYQIKGLPANQLHQIYLSTITGLDEPNSHNHIKIYPNPTLNTLSVKNYTGKAEIYTSLGVKVWSGEVSQNKTINISGLSYGIYYFRTKNTTLKFIVIQ